jgi:hypothetical protein
MFRPVAGLEAKTMEHVVTRLLWEQFHAPAKSIAATAIERNKI